MSAPRHPAPFSDALMPIFADVLDAWTTVNPIRVLDPFAGIGRIHELRVPNRRLETWGVELMSKWAHDHPRTWAGDATRITKDHPRWRGAFDAVVTSPCYGNRMADSHDAKDKCSQCKGSGHGGICVTCTKCGGTGLSPRRSYRHYYGDTFFDDAPLDANAGAMQWGDAYRDLHCAAWIQVRELLVPRGIFVLNIKDHIRLGERQRVAAWHRRTIAKLGFERLETINVSLRGFRHGENHQARLDHEYVYVFRKVK